MRRLPGNYLVLVLLLAAGIGLWISADGGPETSTKTSGDRHRTIEAFAATTGTGIGTTPRLPRRGDVGSLRRVEVDPVFRVIDAETEAGIAGAQVVLFDADESEVYRGSTGVDGRADLSFAPPGAVGLAATAPGYQIGGAELESGVVRLRRGANVQVRVAGASAALLRDYELTVSLHYRGLSEPFEWARQLSESRGVDLVPVVGEGCVVPRPIPKPCKVVLHGRHRAAGTMSDFAFEWLGSEDDTVVFRAGRFATPTGNWARVKIVFPGRRRDHSYNVTLEYETRGRTWRSWDRSGHQAGQRRTEVVRNHVELWSVRYRIRTSMWGAYRGEFISKPFVVEGGVRRTIRVPDTGAQSITFHFAGPDAERFKIDDIALRRGKRAVTSTKELVRPGVVRYLDLQPGTYELRGTSRRDRGVFAARTIVLPEGQHLDVHVPTQSAGTLTVKLPTRDASFSVRRVDAAEALPRSRFLQRRENQWDARLPVGRYIVRVGEREKRVDLDSASATVDFRDD